MPIVVLLHGAEADSAVRSNSLQRRLPPAGVGAFVYDKRGTGSSTGEYTQDFQILARDAVAAMREARRLAGDRAARIGYQGRAKVAGSRRCSSHLRNSVRRLQVCETGRKHRRGVCARHRLRGWIS